MNNEITVIFGKKGSGKTNLARHIVKLCNRLIAFDPMRQFSKCGVVLDNWKDFVIYTGKAKISGRNFRAIYQPNIPALDDEDRVQMEFKRLCGYLYSFFSEITLLVDELDECIDTTSRSRYFRNVVKRGRHRGISLITTTIRYTDVQRSLTSQADKVICFHTHEPADIDYFRNYFGKDAEELPLLPPYHYIKYEKGVVTRHEPVK